MSKELMRVSIDETVGLYSDITVIDKQERSIVFSSFAGGDHTIKPITKSLKKNVHFALAGSGYYNTYGDFDIEKEKQPGEDYSHITIKRKDVVQSCNDDNEYYVFYCLYKDLEHLWEVMYDKLYEHTPVPIMKEWMPYLLKVFEYNGSSTELKVVHSYDEEPLQGRRYIIYKSELLAFIQNGLQKRRISINNTYEASPVMKDVTGLDMYLNIYGDILANKIQKAFVPKFNPLEDKYSEYVNNFDDACYYAGVQLFNAQKAVIQSVVNNMDDNRISIVVGEMGTGKTVQSIGMVYSHYKKKAGSSTVVMCPGHLVEKWKREIERFCPNGKGYIVENLKQLMELENKIKDKSKNEHAFIILSKENAKFSYETRPAVLWSNSKKAYICPDCGKVITKDVTKTINGKRVKVKEKLEKLDFAKELSINAVCPNIVTKYCHETNKEVEVKCNTKLWTTTNKLERNPKWIKLGADGWILKSHIESIHDELFKERKFMNKKKEAFLLKLIEKKEELETTGDATSSSNGVRKYSIAKYIRERLKGHIDYFIGDELDLMAPHTVMCA